MRKEILKEQVDNLYSDIVFDEKVNEKALRKVLSDYLQLKENSTQIIEEITGGLLKHCDYTSERVLQVYHSLQSNKIDRVQTCEDMLLIVGSDPILRESIQEYFRAGE